MDYQPRPALWSQKKQRDRLIALAQQHPTWAVGYQDEVWFSRLAQPKLHSWSDGPGLRLHTKARDKGEQLAIACYGVLLAWSQEMLLRFVKGRPVSCVTVQFLDWVTRTLAKRGTRVLVLVWDNARWHTSQEVRQWVKAHNRKVKARTKRSQAKSTTAKAGCRLLLCPLPTRSPWLNNIEPKWVHGKRNIMEPQRKLEPLELKQRLCSYYNCPLLSPLQQ